MNRSFGKVVGLVVLVGSAAALPTPVTAAGGPASQPASDYPALLSLVDRLEARVKALEAENTLLRAHLAEARAKLPRAVIPGDPVNIAIKEHRIQKGMTVGQVEAAIKGTAYYVDRSATDHDDGQKRMTWELYYQVLGEGGRILVRRIEAEFNAAGTVDHFEDTKIPITERQGDH